LRLRNLRGPRAIHLIDSDKLLHEERLNSMQVFTCIAPLRVGAADALFSVCYVRPCLIDRCRRPSHVGFRTLNTCLGNGNRAHQRRNSSPLIRDLSFESRLL